MRIVVTDVARTFGRQTRAYAEFRVFSSLARFSGVVRDVNVSLTLMSVPHGLTVSCLVVVTIGNGSRLQVRARGRHAYDAIDRAAQRISDEVRRHAEIPLSS